MIVRASFGKEERWFVNPAVSSSSGYIRDGVLIQEGQGFLEQQVEWCLSIGLKEVESFEEARRIVAQYIPVPTPKDQCRRCKIRDEERSKEKERQRKISEHASSSESRTITIYERYNKWIGGLGPVPAGCGYRETTKDLQKVPFYGTLAEAKAKATDLLSEYDNPASGGWLDTPYASSMLENKDGILHFGHCVEVVNDENTVSVPWGSHLGLDRDCSEHPID